MSEEKKGFNPLGAKDVARSEDEGTWIELTDEVGDPLTYGDGDDEKPVTMRVAGTYSDRYRKAEEIRANRISKRSKKPDGATIQRESLEMVVACVMDWDGFVAPDANGALAKMPCDHDNVFLVLKTCPWIREQVESAMVDHERFSKRS